jgi:hypothetical protein
MKTTYQTVFALTLSVWFAGLLYPLKALAISTQTEWPTTRTVQITITPGSSDSVKDFHVEAQGLPGWQKVGVSARPPNNWQTTISGGYINVFGGELPRGKPTTFTVTLPPGYYFNGGKPKVIVTNDGTENGHNNPVNILQTVLGDQATIMLVPIAPLVVVEDTQNAAEISWPVPHPTDPQGKRDYGAVFVKITLKSGQSILFYWTREGQRHPSYKQYAWKNTVVQPRELTFRKPNDPTITDYSYKRDPKDPNDPNEPIPIKLANLQKDSGGAWIFEDLDDLPHTSYRVPVLASSDLNHFIYAAANLSFYLTYNPNFISGIDWQPDDTLDEHGIVIANGQVSGVEGIYWATAPFVFDPNSETGWVPEGLNWLDSVVFQGLYGPIIIESDLSGQIDLISQAQGDINNDDRVDLQDFAVISEHWLDGCGGAP